MIEPFSTKYNVSYFTKSYFNEIRTKSAVLFAFNFFIMLWLKVKHLNLFSTDDFFLRNVAVSCDGTVSIIDWDTGSMDGHPRKYEGKIN